MKEGSSLSAQRTATALNKPQRKTSSPRTANSKKKLLFLFGFSSAPSVYSVVFSSLSTAAIVASRAAVLRVPLRLKLSPSTMIRTDD